MKISNNDIFLRLVEKKDAPFIVKLRTEQKNARFISKTSININDQEKWIFDYKLRELKEDEYYFIACMKDSLKPFGTTRLYNFDQDTFTNGSWVVKREMLPKHSIMVDLLVRSFAFRELNFSNCFFEVRQGNRKVIKYHQMLGAKFVRSDDLNNYYNISKNHFFESLGQFIQLGIIRSEDLDYAVE